MQKNPRRKQSRSADLCSLAPSFRRSLDAEGKSPNTISAYMTALDQFSRFLVSNAMPSAVAAITREHIERFVVDVLRTKAASTANTRYRGLQQFFRWLLEEEEIDRSPMEHMKPPQIPESKTDVVTEDELRRLLKACAGKAFEDRRDLALISLLLDTGMREGECAGLRIEDVDFDHNLANVLGKGRRPRSCPFGKQTARDLDRYLRERANHPHADSAMLWLGRRGPMTGWGVYQVVQKRAAQAGIDDVHPHRFRHTYAHQWLARGGQEGDLMRLGGWRSRTMLSRYGASAADERARDAYKNLSPRDRL